MWVAWNMCPNCWMSLHAYDDTKRMMIYRHGYAQGFETWRFFVKNDGAAKGQRMEMDHATKSVEDFCFLLSGR